MKTFVTLLFTGAMLALTAAAADNGAEARFRMKYGRGTPAAEARTTAVENEAAACMHGCCVHHAAKTAVPPVAVGSDAGAEARFQAKWGRNIPSKQVPVLVAAAGPALPTDNGAAARFSLKFGRSLPMSVPPAETASVLVSSAHLACSCEMPCCKQAD